MMVKAHLLHAPGQHSTSVSVPRAGKYPEQIVLYEGLTGMMVALGILHAVLTVCPPTPSPRLTHAAEGYDPLAMGNPNHMDVPDYSSCSSDEQLERGDDGEDAGLRGKKAKEGQATNAVPSPGSRRKFPGESSSSSSEGEGQEDEVGLQPASARRSFAGESASSSSEEEEAGERAEFGIGDLSLERKAFPGE